jgi:hypothetical protein
MEFFTPELYRQFNSSDDQVADQADAAWEQAIHNYQRHLERIRDRLPVSARTLSELNLHDAEILGVEQDAQALTTETESAANPLWSAVVVVTVKQKDIVRSLIYTLWDKIRQTLPPHAWPFSAEQKHWLYDEVDLFDDQRRWFLHRILCSDGSVLEIPFASVMISTIQLPKYEARNLVAQTT